MLCSHFMQVRFWELPLLSTWLMHNLQTSHKSGGAGENEDALKLRAGGSMVEWLKHWVEGNLGHSSTLWPGLGLCLAWLQLSMGCFVNVHWQSGPREVWRRYHWDTYHLSAITSRPQLRVPDSKWQSMEAVLCPTPVSNNTIIIVSFMLVTVAETKDPSIHSWHTCLSKRQRAKKVHCSVQWGC